MIELVDKKKIERGIKYFKNIISSCSPISNRSAGIDGFIISGHTKEGQRIDPALYTEQELRNHIDSAGLNISDDAFSKKLEELSICYQKIKDAEESKGYPNSYDPSLEQERRDVQHKLQEHEANLSKLELDLKQEKINSERSFLDGLSRKFILFYCVKFFIRLVMNVITLGVWNKPPIIDYFQGKINEERWEIRFLKHRLSYINDEIVQENSERSDDTLRFIDDRDTYIDGFVELFLEFSLSAISKSKALTSMYEAFNKKYPVEGVKIRTNREFICPITEVSLPVYVATQPIKKFILPFVLVVGSFFRQRYGDFKKAQEDKDPVFMEFQEFLEFVSEKGAPEFSMEAIEKKLSQEEQPKIIQALVNFQERDGYSREDQQVFESFNLQFWQLEKLYDEFLPGIKPQASMLRCSII